METKHRKTVPFFKVLFSYFRAKSLTCFNIPTPAAFFQPLYSLHNGNFKVRNKFNFFLMTPSSWQEDFFFLGLIILAPEQNYWHVVLTFLRVRSFTVSCFHIPANHQSFCPASCSLEVELFQWLPAQTECKRCTLSKPKQYQQLALYSGGVIL